MEEKPFVRDIFGNKLQEGDWVAFKFDPQVLTVAKVLQATPHETSRLTGERKTKPAILRLLIDVTLDVLNPLDAFSMVARTAGPNADAKIDEALKAAENPSGLLKPS